ncbi:hypothetical protein BST96_08135 [Oceanicoccus sagamiensis]|uniref:Uncharacterized protein n=1 Tax=Oceanicoccus sagamiensis TaxID=716816 RepID=A0A1X9NJC7_9GAMM|nr:hypothetical protein BST96_08135 [Oceanicoccus sagamiensis]
MLAGLVSTLAINIYMDPLWYFDGNKLTKQNFAFNERLSKPNRYIKTSDNYDCLILGSSRATLLNESLIEGYNCYNFAFSGGKTEEYLAYSKWLNNRGASPRRIIIAIDDRDFTIVPGPINIPDFIQANSAPPVFWKNYLTLGSLNMSRRLLANISPLPRYYDDEFYCRIFDTAPVYKPELEDRSQVVLKENIAELYRELKGIFKNSEFIAYITPVSTWKVASRTERESKHYFQSAYAISTLFNPLYDFSIPSDRTSKTDNTYDGDHYSVELNNEISTVLNNGTTGFGIKVNDLSERDYINIYTKALNKYKAELMIDTVSVVSEK